MPAPTEQARRHYENAGDLRVLLVEDTAMIVRLVTRMLDGESGFVLSQGGSDVFALMHESLWDEIDVAVVDLLLPSATGGELLRWLEAHAPHVRRVAMSGWSPDRLQDDVPCHVRLLKPFTVEEMLAAVRP